jgi:CRISPR-associated protein Csm3
MTEWKFENGLDRITAAANPRQLERVPAGSEFNFELVYTLENATQAQEDLRNLAIALAILEDDALGGHGSRGYGKVSFKHFQLSYRDIAQYRQVASGGGDGFTPMALDNTADLLNRFGEIQALLPASGAST